MFSAATMPTTQGRQNELRPEAPTPRPPRVEVGSRRRNRLRHRRSGSPVVALSAAEGPAGPRLTAGRRHRPGYELVRSVSTMQHPVRKLSAAAIVATTSFLGFMSLPGGAARGPYDADKVPGVHARVDCVEGTGYVEIGNTDMAGSTIVVTIDGARRPDLHVDSTGYIHQWYSLVPGQPHRLSIIYDFVPGGTADEENQVITVSCLEGQPLTDAAGDISGACSASPQDGPLCPDQTRAITTGVDGGLVDG